MLISYCLPCHKRTSDLVQALPFVVKAAEADGATEIVVVDYANPKEGTIWPIVGRIQEDIPVYVRIYTERDHFHMSHARNLSIRSAGGVYVVIGSSDLCPQPDFFKSIRKRIVETGATLLKPADDTYRGVIVCKRSELIAAGGYDERIEMYGAEDKDLQARLERRGVSTAYYEPYLAMIRTTNDQKVANYRLKLTKTEMMAHGDLVYRANVAAGQLVANEGVPWGE